MRGLLPSPPVRLIIDKRMINEHGHLARQEQEVARHLVEMYHDMRWEFIHERRGQTYDLARTHTSVSAFFMGWPWRWWNIDAPFTLLLHYALPRHVISHPPNDLMSFNFSPHDKMLHLIFWLTRLLPGGHVLMSFLKFENILINTPYSISGFVISTVCKVTNSVKQ